MIEFNSTEPSESSLSRIWRQVSEHDSGCISGWRKNNSPQQNNSNNSEISAYLIEKGYSVTEIDKVYKDLIGEQEKKDKENSFFVVDIKDTGMLKNDLAALGKRYEQESILIIPRGGMGAYLVGKHPDGAFPAYAQEEALGNLKFDNLKREYCSRVVNKPFTFENAQPATFYGRWGRYAIAKRVAKELDEIL